MLITFRKSLPKFTDKLFDLGVALGSGILMGITFAPVEAWYFAWAALAPLWYLVCRDRNSNSIVYALCWGIGFYGLGLSWIFGIHPMTWMGVPYFASLGIATFCLTFITLWGASLAILWSISLKFINSKLLVILVSQSNAETLLRSLKVVKALAAKLRHQPSRLLRNCSLMS